MKRPGAIEEETIRHRVGRHGLRRGWDYFLSGAVLQPCRQGSVLKAFCAGRSVSAYRVEATLTGQGIIIDAGCTCPVGADGSCKHVAALLIAWKERPQDFVEIEPLGKALARLSQSELSDLVKELVDRRPELEIVIGRMLANAKERAENTIQGQATG